MPTTEMIKIKLRSIYGVIFLGFVLGALVSWVSASMIQNYDPPQAFHDVVRDYAKFDQNNKLDYQATFVKNKSCTLKDFVIIGSRASSENRFLKWESKEGFVKLYDRPAGSNTLYISIEVPEEVDRVDIKTIHECEIVQYNYSNNKTIEKVRIDSTFDTIDTIVAIPHNNREVKE